MTLDNAVLVQMAEVARPQVSRQEAEILARMVQTPEELAEALWRYGCIGWLRGQRFERARAADASARIWDVRPLGAR